MREEVNVVHFKVLLQHSQGRIQKNLYIQTRSTWKTCHTYHC